MGTLLGGGMVIVKVLRSLDNEEIWQRVHDIRQNLYQNLLKIVSLDYSSMDLKDLVLEFMLNENFDSDLHGVNDGKHQFGDAVTNSIRFPYGCL